MPNAPADAAVATLLASPNASAAPAPVPALAPLSAIDPDLDALDIDLHRTPELSLHEEKTSAKLAGRLGALGYDVTERVGGYGVFGEIGAEAKIPSVIFWLGATNPGEVHRRERRHDAPAVPAFLGVGPGPRADAESGHFRIDGGRSRAPRPSLSRAPAGH